MVQIKMKAVIFDMDGLIFDTENMFLNCWRIIAADHGLTGMEELYRRVIGLNADATRAAYLEFYGDNFAYDELNQLAVAIFLEKSEKEGIPLKPGAVELLEYLSNNDYCLGLASSTKTEHVRSQLLRYGLLKYFKAVIGGDMVEKSKPEPDIFLEACRKIKAAPADTYAIEDSYNGVRAANAAGMKVIMVPDIILPDEEMKQIAYRIIQSLFGVKKFFINEK